MKSIPGHLKKRKNNIGIFTVLKVLVILALFRIWVKFSVLCFQIKVKKIIKICGRSLLLKFHTFSNFSTWAFSLTSKFNFLAFKLTLSHCLFVTFSIQHLLFEYASVFSCLSLYLHLSDILLNCVWESLCLS